MGDASGREEVSSQPRHLPLPLALMAPPLKQSTLFKHVPGTKPLSTQSSLTKTMLPKPNDGSADEAAGGDVEMKDAGGDQRELILNSYEESPREV